MAAVSGSTNSLKIYLLSFVIFIFLLISQTKSSPVPQEFQKPHFQVEHKAGVLSITATKDKADVDVKSDTIRLLVKPGDRQYPVGDAPEVKTVHIEGNYPQIYPV
ncbi:hypothetical protein pdam_00006887 [Pocillopora damicornis]|uniref:SHSP domain-containing protein n=2 Tax=Pocillopora TaxID=46730 RepID=A0A3M6TP38_POCDA|nr:hypothetical protein pdam_00006887 [Pocillopora damicornis]CAH3155589.1 unnamed protein product [Pocillopora meandrina]